MVSPYPRVRLSCNLNQCMDFYETWYDYYTTRWHPMIVHFNVLPTTILTKCEILRLE
jgi:hypothetical protein